MHIKLSFLFNVLFLILSSDVEPPWIQCPRDIVAGTDERRNTANVSWNVPIATDNSDEEVRHLTKAITVWLHTVMVIQDFFLMNQGHYLTFKWVDLNNDQVLKVIICHLAYRK